MSEHGPTENLGHEQGNVLPFRPRSNGKKETPQLLDKKLIRRRMAPAFHAMVDSLAEMLALTDPALGYTHPGFAPDGSLNPEVPKPEALPLNDELTARRTERAIRRVGQRLGQLAKAHGRPLPQPEEPLLPLEEDE